MAGGEGGGEMGRYGGACWRPSGGPGARRLYAGGGGAGPFSQMACKVLHVA